MRINPDEGIAIIGGGASAVLLLAHFSKIKSKPVYIRVFDRSGVFGRGIAYSTFSENHLLNVRAARMSALEDDPTHFASWASKLQYMPSDFVPRPVYAHYLASVLDDAVAQLKAQGHEVEFISADVISSRAHSAQDFTLETTTGDFHAAKIILATGNASPISVEGADALNPADGYYADPWRIDYAKIPNDTDIVFLGTGLSMVDAAVSLHHAGFKGSMIALSRRGLLPAIHAEPQDYKWDLKDRLPDTALEWLRLIRAKTKNNPWQAVIDGLRPHTNRAWEQLSKEEQKKFLKRLLSFWNIHRHRMATEVGAVIQSLQKSGQLKIEKANIRSLKKSGKKIKILGAEKTLEADIVINCLGYQYKPLPGRQYEVSVKIGPPLWGEHIETTAIPEIRAQAASLAKRLAGS